MAFIDVLNQDQEAPEIIVARTKAMREIRKIKDTERFERMDYFDLLMELDANPISKKKMDIVLEDLEAELAACQSRTALIKRKAGDVFTQATVEDNTDNSDTE